MVRATLVKLGRPAARALLRRSAPVALATRPVASPPVPSVASGARALFSSTACRAGPVPADVLKNTKPTEITDAEYHELSNQYLDHLCDRFEELQETSPAYDFDYSVSGTPPPRPRVW